MVISQVLGNNNCANSWSGLTGSGTISVSYSISGTPMLGRTLTCVAPYSYSFSNGDTSPHIASYTVVCHGTTIGEAPTINKATCVDDEVVPATISGSGIAYDISTFNGGPMPIFASITGAGGLSASDSTVAY